MSTDTTQLHWVKGLHPEVIGDVATWSLEPANGYGGDYFIVIRHRPDGYHVNDQRNRNTPEDDDYAADAIVDTLEEAQALGIVFARME